MTDTNKEELDLENLDLQKEEEASADEEGKSLSENFEKQLESAVNERLKGMKTSIDKAYAKIKDLTKELETKKEESEKLKRKRLEEEGRHLEAAQLKIAELEAKEKALSDRLTSLSRDRELENALGSLEFRSDFAKRTAFDYLVKELVQDEDGIWVHSTGASVKDFIKTFFKDPEKEFLLRPVNNSGAGAGKEKGPLREGKPKSLEGLSSEAMLDLARKGLLK